MRRGPRGLAEAFFPRAAKRLAGVSRDPKGQNGPVDHFERRTPRAWASGRVTASEGLTRGRQMGEDLDMEARQITVFGGSGFLGRYVVRALAKKGWRIKVATRRPNRAFFLRPMGQVGQIGFVKCDVADAGQIAHALAGSQAAVNLAGILFQRGQTFQDVHVKGPEAIAEAASRLGLRAFVHVSAIGADAES